MGIRMRMRIRVWGGDLGGDDEGNGDDNKKGGKGK